MLTIALWKAQGAKIGPGVMLWGKVRLQGNVRRLTIGANVTLNEGVLIELRDAIAIGTGSTLSSGVKLHTGLLRRHPDKTLFHVAAPIRIGERVWVAAEAVVCAGVEIDDDISIGANAVVTRSLTEPGLYFGAPAKQYTKQ